MLERYASNSILTKARAGYGRRITLDNYKDMASLSSVGEIATYLKIRTAYFAALSDIKDSALHRDNLEKMLSKHLLRESKRLCRFESSVGEHIFEYILRNGEIQSVLSFIRLLAAGRPEDFILDISYTFDRFSKLNLLKLAAIRSVSELGSFLKSTPYRAITALLPQTDSEPFDFTIIESALYKQLFDFTFHMIETNFTGTTKSQLESIISLRAELMDFLLIYRSRRFYDPDIKILRSLLMGYKHFLSPKTIEKMLYAKDAAEILDIFKSTKYSQMLQNNPLTDGITHFSESAVNNYIVKNIHFSTSPAVVMLSYTIFCEVELENITTIIEGVRYKVSPDDILKSLIIFKKKGD